MSEHHNARRIFPLSNVGDATLSATPSDPVQSLSMPQHDMVPERMPSSSGPLKRKADNPESPSKRFKMDGLSSLLPIQSDDVDTIAPTTSELGKEIRRYLGSGLGLSHAERERLNLNIDIGDMGARCNQKVRRLAERYRIQTEENNQYISSTEEGYRLGNAEKDVEITVLKSKLAELSPPFSLDRIRRVVEAKEAVENLATQKEEQIANLKEELRVERIGRQRDRYEARQKFDKLEAMREADCHVFTHVLAAKQPFSSSCFATPLSWKSKDAQIQLEQPVSDDDTASIIHDFEPTEVSANSDFGLESEAPEGHPEEIVQVTPAPQLDRRSIQKKKKKVLRTIDDYIETKANIIRPFSASKLASIAGKSSGKGRFRLNRIMKYVQEKRRMTLRLDELQKLYWQAARSEVLDLERNPEANKSAPASVSTEEPVVDEGTTKLSKEASSHAALRKSSESVNEARDSSTGNQPSALGLSHAVGGGHIASSPVGNNQPTILFGRTGSATSPGNPFSTPFGGAFASTTHSSGFGMPSAASCSTTKSNNKDSGAPHKAAENTQENNATFALPTQPRKQRDKKQALERKRKSKGPADSNYHKNIQESNQAHRKPLMHKDGNSRQAPAATASADMGFSVKGAAEAAAKPSPVAQSDPYAASRQRNQETREQLKASRHQAPQPSRGGGPRGRR